jgi:hypothetical protein
MTLGKRPPGARLQVSLEANRSLLVWEFENNVTLPRAIFRGVRTTTGVVIFNSFVYVGRQTDIEAGCGAAVLDDIDETLFCRPTRPGSKRIAGEDFPKMT